MTETGAVAVLCQEIETVVTRDTPLGGTLCLPAASGRPVPAILLVQGSGPTDRDGNQRPALVTDLLRQVAGILASSGIASFRYDKRGLHANGAHLPKDLPTLTEFVRWEHFVADAGAALAMLRARPEIDPARVGLFGHSEGGLIALDLAARGGRAPDAIVLAATPGRPIAAVLRDQLERLGRRQGGSDAALKPLLDENDRILAHLVATGDYPATIPPNLAALYPPYLRLFLRSLAMLDPVPLAERCPAPILLISGSEDVQVLAGRDAGMLAAALERRRAAGGPSHRVEILAGASHNLKSTAGPDDHGFSGTLHPGVAEALHRWLGEIGWAHASQGQP